MKIEFTKMHGAANDYIYINCMTGDFDPEFPYIAGLAAEMSARHFSVGADGVVLICPSDIADARMRIFNADGSEGKMCGNAIRCVGKFLFDNDITEKTELDIETLSGVKHLYLTVKNNNVSSVSVDMGMAELGLYSDFPISVGGNEYNVTTVSMGNPHAVIFTNNIDSIPLDIIGPLFENHKLFCERVNTEFIEVSNERILDMRVWERGSGETWACGTGACAAVSAAVYLGICKADTPVTVRLRGGELVIKVCADFSVNMTGGAEKVYEGVYEYDV